MRPPCTAPIHRFLHGGRVCQCGAVTVPEPTARVRTQQPEATREYRRAQRVATLQAIEQRLDSGAATRVGKPRR